MQIMSQWQSCRIYICQWPSTIGVCEHRLVFYWLGQTLLVLDQPISLMDRWFVSNVMTIRMGHTFASILIYTVISLAPATAIILLISVLIAHFVIINVLRSFQGETMATMPGSPITCNSWNSCKGCTCTTWHSPQW